jgi:hypothetical protein
MTIIGFGMLAVFPEKAYTKRPTNTKQHHSNLLALEIGSMEAL